MNQSIESPGKKAWKRLKKNKSAMTGMYFIAACVFIAVFAYFLAPDNSTNSDEQILQLETHAPGFSIQLLKVKRDKQLKYSNGLTKYFYQLIDGNESAYELIPILDYQVVGENMVFTEYLGKNFEPKKRSLSLVDILYAKSQKSDAVEYENGKAIFTNVDEQKVSVEISQMSTQIKSAIFKRTFYLGTDKFGRDILSRMILGVRVSLSVGIVSVFISFIIGVFLGACAGYFGGWIDDIIMWFITVFWSIPTFLLAMGLSLSLTSEFVTKLTGIDFGESFKFILIFVAVGLTMWVDMARMVRGQFISIKEKEYVEAAQSLGYSSFRTIVKHILPNIMGPVIVILAADFASAILTESALSYLGLGIQAPKPSWGQMLSEYRDFLNTDKAYLTLIPGFAIMCIVLAFNLIGNGLRDALDVRAN
jgi:ABC-type dipeptide/oligopeptide/nickel transport system permease subunit